MARDPPNTNSYFFSILFTSIVNIATVKKQDKPD